MRVLITGAGGLVGQNLQAHTDSKKYDILTPTSKELDLRNFDEVSTFLMREKPDAVIHAAGTVGGIQANIADQLRFLCENLDMGKNIVIASKNAGVKKLINLGTSCMYPRDAVNPLKEELILSGNLEPTNEGYAIAKVTISRLCRYICDKDSSFYYKTLIPPNLYGPFDNYDSSRSHMVPSVIDKLHKATVNDKPSVEIWGDGQARREFMFAQDAADAIWFFLANLEYCPSELNIGIDEDFSILEYYEKIAEIVNFQGKFTYDLGKPVGMSQKLMDSSKAKALGWTSKVALEDGLASAYKHYLMELKNGKVQIPSC